MKKQTLLILSALVSTISFAQVQPSFGIRAGLSSAGMRGNAISNFNSLLNFAKGSITTSNHTGFFAGGYVSIPVSSVFSVEPAAYYSQKGYDLNGAINVKGFEFLGAAAKAKLSSQYIDLPVVLKANLAGFQLFAGPQVSYLTQANLKASAGILGINLLNTKLDATPLFNRWDVAATAGMGYQFANGINLTAAYDYGLSKVDAGNNLNSYNHSFKLGIGFSF